MQIKPVQGLCPAQRVNWELRQLIVAQVEGPQGRGNGSVKEHHYQKKSINKTKVKQFQMANGIVQLRSIDVFF